jgi:hypothetical protein
MSCQHFKEHHPICSDCSRNSIINAEERKSKYSLINPQRREVCKVRVDNCVIATDSKQCDYLFLSCETFIAYFIELKGKNLSHAIDQLDQSIDHLLNNIGEFTINARVVLSKTQTPDIRTIKYKKFKAKIGKLKGTFIHKNRLLVETLE